MQLFVSRDTRYRKPFGAVEEGTTLEFRICLPREWHCHAAWFIRRIDEGQDRWDGMFWAGMEGTDCEWWDCRYTPEKAALYWYSFAVDTDAGRRFFICRPDSSAALSETRGEEWQLTCYEKGFSTPEWPVGGVFYQIFPDRFAKHGEPQQPIPADRLLHDNWGDPPVWQPDAQGVIHNNDYFGGNLRGICRKLPYLKSLGVTCVYLNPIFEAHSNHRYDTADYTHIDPLLGTEEEFKELTEAAKRLGIRILLDGVFSHTGADSIYFNKNRRYQTEGAYQSLESPYASWYRFSRWPTEYGSWWGFTTLPEVDELSPGFLEFITGENGIARRWLTAGAGGWRLDVADELPDAFLEIFRTAVKETNAEAMVLGEVWEDASNKQSYGHRRRYLLGRQLDSVMNYPFRQAVLDFIRFADAEQFFNTVESIVENYPPQVTRLLMNSLGTHDTERALTVLAGEPANGRGRRWQAQTKLTAEQRAKGIVLLKLASLLQYCLPGIPCLYYGDEAGMEGYRDPFNRGCFPWDEPNKELLLWFRQLGAARASCEAFREGSFNTIYKENGVVAFERCGQTGKACCAVNLTDKQVSVPINSNSWEICVGEGKIDGHFLYLNSLSGVILTAKSPK